MNLADGHEALIADAAQRLFDAEFPLASLRAGPPTRELPHALRRAIGQSGWLGLCAHEAAGGSGLGAREALPVLVEAGRHAAPFPLAEGIAAVQRLSSVPQQRPLARQLISGDRLATIADLPAGPVSVTATADGWTVDGTWRGVPWAQDADRLLVSLPLEPPTWVVVDLGAATVQRRACESMDAGTRLAEVTLHGHAVAAEDRTGGDDVTWNRLRTLLAAAELQGAAQACLDLSVAYMKERQQFGQPIGRFQSLKHIAANGALHLENMRAANAFAAWAHDACDTEAEEAAHIAKSYASEHARTVAEDAIQCHGGLGITWEYGLHYFLRRIVRLGASCGTAHEHREALLTSCLAGLAHAPASSHPTP